MGIRFLPLRGDEVMSLGVDSIRVDTRLVY